MNKTEYLLLISPFEWTDGSTLFEVLLQIEDREDTIAFAAKSAHDAAQLALSIRLAIDTFALDSDVIIETKSTEASIALEEATGE